MIQLNKMKKIRIPERENHLLNNNISHVSLKLCEKFLNINIQKKTESFWEEKKSLQNMKGIHSLSYHSSNSEKCGLIHTSNTDGTSSLFTEPKKKTNIDRSKDRRTNGRAEETKV